MKTTGTLALSLTSAIIFGVASAAAAVEIKGDVSCKLGDVDCNVCANNVEKQFFDAFDHDSLEWKTWKWHFKFNDRLPPDNHEPGDVMATGVANHVQGFARTNRDDIRYVMSHSADEGDHGAVFFIQKGSSRNSLVAMHRSSVAHPMSVFSIGQYAGTAEGEEIKMFDLRKVKTAQNYGFPVSEIEAGGGLGMAKLADGSHLLVSYGKGGNNPSYTRYATFYHIKGPLTKPTQVTKLDDNVYTQPSSWKGDYQYSDNLSVITECRTGNLYSIHTSGEEKFNGRGYWRLSRIFSVTDGRGSIAMSTVGGRWQDQDNDSCWLRGGASVHVNKEHELEFYCHERKAIKGGFGLLENKDHMTFKWGGLKPAATGGGGSGTSCIEGKTKFNPCAAGQAGTGLTYTCRSNAWKLTGGFCEVGAPPGGFVP